MIVSMESTDKTSAMVTETKTTDKVSSLTDKNPRGRRPGLGLKRAKFSMKPMPSEPDVVSEPTFDPAKYKDPVEFFAALDRHENAIKEIQRLKGQPVPVLKFDPNLHLAPRRRRPSIFGSSRKPAIYKHRSYSSEVVDDIGDVSQSSHIARPTCQDALPETDIVNNSQHTEVSDHCPSAMNRSTAATSDPVDPLAGCNSFSLFPISFNRLPIDNLNPYFDPLSHHNAVVLKSTDKLLLQAKTILDDSMETDKTSAMVTESKTDKVSSLSDKNPRERRPGLGLKRVKFSMKPMQSQPDVVSEPTFDPAKYKDPVEFFAAFERHENAIKEIQRLKGQPVPVLKFDPNLHMSPRRRRPSIFGSSRKPATYKHRSYSSEVVDDNGDVSQSSHMASPTCQDALPETDIVNNSQHTEVSDLTPVMTSEQDEFDELLSFDYEGLDDAGVLDILKEKLQIPLKDVDKPVLPDSLYVPRRESETCDDALSKMTVDIARRKSACSQHLSLNSQHRETSVCSQVAPVQSKSPLASISLLNKYISKLSPMKDPFSALVIDSPPVRIPSPKTGHGAQPNKLDTGKDLYESGTSLMHVEENSAPEEQLDVVRQSDHDGARKDVEECGTFATHGEETNALLSLFSPSLEGNNISSTSEPKECFLGETQSAQVAEEMDVFDFSKSHAHREQRVADAGEDSLVFEGRGVDPSSENMEQENEVQLEVNIEGSTSEKSNVYGVGGSTICKVWNTDDIDIEQPNKEASEPSKRKLENRRKSKVAENTCSETVKKGGKEKAQADLALSENATNRKRKAQEEASRASNRKLMSRRNSLYGAGTIIENGCRRSTRIKMPPLKYWKGERFLFGRLHESLATVIGVKYVSPSKEAEENPALKVKSFVSKKYKEMVELAALH